MTTIKYALPPEFLVGYKDKNPPMDALGLATMLRTYAAPGENWFDICKRVIEGTWSQYLNNVNGPEAWGMPRIDHAATVMFDEMFNLNWMPAGRGIQHMGHDRVDIKGGALLNSCAFVSSEEKDWVYFLADMLMLGTGVGFDTRAALPGLAPSVSVSVPPFFHPLVVSDTREGWALALDSAWSALTGRDLMPHAFDFSHLRPRGAPLKTMGGISSGPLPLVEAIENIFAVFADRSGYTTARSGSEEGNDLRLWVTRREEPPAKTPITALDVLDVGNIVGKCVVSGGIRRSAQICLFEPEHWEDCFRAKQDQEKLMAWRWASNNSIKRYPGGPPFDWQRIVESCSSFGDPGVFDEEQAGMGERIHSESATAILGCNPCGEQVLESKELCNLIEVRYTDNAAELRTRVGCAYLYGKIVTTIATHRKDINQVVGRNRRIGISLTGICEKPLSVETLKAVRAAIEDWEQDAQYRAGIPRSIKVCTVKPSGTVSLLMDCTPGVNPAFAEHYKRRVTFEETSPLVAMLKEAGYETEPHAYTPRSVCVVFPKKASGLVAGQMPAERQLEYIELLQKHWSDNMVSSTIVYEDAEIPGLVAALKRTSGIKSLSLLRKQHGFVQPPLEEITREEFANLSAAIRPIDQTRGVAFGQEDDKVFCDGDKCFLGAPGSD